MPKVGTPLGAQSQQEMAGQKIQGKGRAEDEASAVRRRARNQSESDKADGQSDGRLEQLGRDPPCTDLLV